MNVIELSKSLLSKNNLSRKRLFYLRSLIFKITYCFSVKSLHTLYTNISYALQFDTKILYVYFTLEAIAFTIQIREQRTQATV